MRKFFEENAVTIIICVITLASTFTLYGYRISALETSQAKDEKSFTLFKSDYNDSNTQIQVSLARIETDITYIKAEVSK